MSSVDSKYQRHKREGLVNIRRRRRKKKTAKRAGANLDIFEFRDDSEFKFDLP